MGPKGSTQKKIFERDIKKRWILVNFNYDPELNVKSIADSISEFLNSKNTTDANTVINQIERTPTEIGIQDRVHSSHHPTGAKTLIQT